MSPLTGEAGATVVPTSATYTHFAAAQSPDLFYSRSWDTLLMDGFMLIKSLQRSCWLAGRGEVSTGRGRQGLELSWAHQCSGSSQRGEIWTWPPHFFLQTELPSPEPITAQEQAQHSTPDLHHCTPDLHHCSDS